MKKIITLALLPVCAAVLLSVSSCGKKTTTPATGGTVTMTYRGSTHTFTTTGALAAAALVNNMTLSADESGTGKSFDMGITGGHTSGTYSYNSGNLIEITGTSNDPVYTTTNSYGGYSQGSMIINISGSSATAHFTGTLYSIQNPADSMAFTGDYSGAADVY